MRFVTFNVNGIRARLHQLETLVERHSPDVIGLQETKVDDPLFPVEAIENLGYHVVYHGQPGHYGVALLTRSAPLETGKGLPGDDDSAQRRLVSAVVDSPVGPVHVYNGYFPQGEARDHPVKFPAKQRFYADLTTTLRERHSDNDLVVVMGDMNIAPTDDDIGIGEENRKRWLRQGKTSFLPEEREWIHALTSTGLIDPYHALRGDSPVRYSWFDYRSGGFERDPKRGLRIDLILVSSPLAELARAMHIDYDVRALERPSDHCPVMLDLAE